MFLSVENLSYQRGEKALFEGLSFGLNPGELLWILGENGVGKSTLLQMLAGYYTHYSGEIGYIRPDANSDAGSDASSTADSDAGQQGPEILYIGHENGVHPNLTVMDNLKSLLGLRHNLGWVAEDTEHERCMERAVYEVGLQGYEDTMARSLSAGQKKRVALAQLVVPFTATLWLLDEPFTALDVKGVDWLNQTFEAHLARGGMIVFTSHQFTLADNIKHSALDLGEYRPSLDTSLQGQQRL